MARAATPGDIAILFRSRTSHREFQQCARGTWDSAYVYKGLGFFDADEIKDVSALIRYLADPNSDLRAAAFLRSRFVAAVGRCARRSRAQTVAAIIDPAPPSIIDVLDPEDRSVLQHLRARVGGWLASVDRVAPADLIERILRDTAYRV
jgi:ATP-dependent exoDNAse (exonuclease V) beta subunit